MDQSKCTFTGHLNYTSSLAKLACDANSLDSVDAINQVKHENELLNLKLSASYRPNNGENINNNNRPDNQDNFIMVTFTTIKSLIPPPSSQSYSTPTSKAINGKMFNHSRFVYNNYNLFAKL